MQEQVEMKASRLCPDYSPPVVSNGIFCEPLKHTTEPWYRIRRRRLRIMLAFFRPFR